MSHTIYILLTRSRSWFSRLIHLTTQDRYTHASIGLEGPAGPYYSFGGRNPRFALPAGLVQEQLSLSWTCDAERIPCCLLALKVDDRTFSRIWQRVRVMYVHKEQYHYNLLGVLSCCFALPLARQHHYFCSQFVADLLQSSGAADIPVIPALLRPMDLFYLDGLRTIHQGSLADLQSAFAA